MQLLRFTLIIFIFVINLLVAFSSWAETPPSLMSKPDYFQVGKKVIWLYKARADSADTQRIPAEIVKLGSKQVQIKVSLHGEKFINRWVNRNRLENFHEPKQSISNSI
jgi:hypothetical protein